MSNQSTPEVTRAIQDILLADPACFGRVTADSINAIAALVTPARGGDELREAAQEMLVAFAEGVVWNNEQRAAYTALDAAVGSPHMASIIDADDDEIAFKRQIAKQVREHFGVASPPPVDRAEAIRAVTAEMRKLMPNACGDWADKIDAILRNDGPNQSGTFACPICGQDTPHNHMPAVVDAYQNKGSRA